MKNLLELFRSGNLTNKKGKAISLNLIPLEVETNKQYKGHLNKILHENYVMCKNNEIKLKIAQAKYFLISDKKTYDADIWNKYLVSNDSIQNDEERTRMISWSPIYQTDEYNEIHHCKIKDIERFKEIFKSWYKCAKDSKERLINFCKKRRIKIMKAIFFELRMM